STGHSRHYYLPRDWKKAACDHLGGDVITNFAERMVTEKNDQGDRTHMIVTILVRITLVVYTTRREGIWQMLGGQAGKYRV
ncbi:MAG: hypothetical protein QXI12_09885, partial [Candidatus Methanomethyliaceae archaeon]